MTELTPPAVETPKTEGEDPRLGQLLQPEINAATEVVLVGFPSDEGVRRNLGRTGAARGPGAIRSALYRMTPDPTLASFAELAKRTVDLGDLVLRGELEREQEALGRLLAGHLEAGRLAVILGGGHETAYGHFLGYVGASQDVSILNWDAHADVRPLRDGLAHSGSPFRQMLEHQSGRADSYRVAGLARHSVSAAHLELVGSRGEAFFSDELTNDRVSSLVLPLDGRTMVTFDLDAVDAAHAPGVSAPRAGGLGPDLWLHAAERCGQSPNVTSMDVCELNPRYDIDGRTALLAALTVWRFLFGVARRRSESITA